ncbi:hypothetical protein D3C71_1351090 [compost metagenome]
MPVHQPRGMPEQQRQRQVQHHGEPHRALERRVFGHFLAELGTAQVHLGELPAVDQGRQAHHRQKASRVQGAQHEHVTQPLLPGTKRHQQHGRCGKPPLRGLRCRHHHGQGGRWQQHQRHRRADQWNHGGQRHGRHGHEKQRCQCHGLLPERPYTKLDPGHASAGGDDVEFHEGAAEERWGLRAGIAGSQKAAHGSAIAWNLPQRPIPATAQGLRRALGVQGEHARRARNGWGRAA